MKKNEQLADNLALLGLSERGFAALIRRSHSIVQRWINGDAVIPTDVATWLERVAEFHRANPPPPPPPPHPAGRRPGPKE